MTLKRHLSRKALVKLRDEAISCWQQECKTCPERASAFAVQLKTFDEAITAGDLSAAEAIAPQIMDHLKSRGGKIFRWLKELILTLVIALAIAGVCRQSWFELYEIPTGSMRPTFKEGDDVLVSKSAFGINIPFKTDHLAFDPSRVKHGSILVITGDNVSLPDTDTKYFGIFPGKRRYVKRCAGLPGEYLYFYGGKIYCMSKDEKQVSILPDAELSNLEYIPFISFDGSVEVASSNRFGRKRTYLLKHFNIPLAKVVQYDNGNVESLISSPEGWIQEFADDESESSKSYPRSIGEFWGMSNYAQARILLHNQLPEEAKKHGYESAESLAYLELRHSPTLPTANEKYTKEQGGLLVKTCTSWMPLNEEACEKLMHNLYTARFVVKNGKASRYNQDGTFDSYTAVSLPKRIPDGTYEFYNGIAYSIGYGSYATMLPHDHAIYPTNVEELQIYYNAGIEWAQRYIHPAFVRFPSRYAYFRDGSLYVLGQPIIPAHSEELNNFDELEIVRQSKDYGYFGFQDQGSPINEKGEFKADFFKNFGLKIADSNYILLGDNHAMSLDSRYFGSIPEQNIQGTPIVRFWPLQSRLEGRDGPSWLLEPPQPNLPPSKYSLLICGSVAGISLIAMFLNRRGRKKRLDAFRKSV